MPAPLTNNPAKSVRHRSRRGCLTCRDHRVKCDESTPACGNCKRLERKCEWGLKASFSESRMLRLSDSDLSSLSEIESARDFHSSLKFLDETRDIALEYNQPEENLLESDAANSLLSLTLSPSYQSSQLSREEYSNKFEYGRVSAGHIQSTVLESATSWKRLSGTLLSTETPGKNLQINLDPINPSLSTSNYSNFSTTNSPSTNNLPIDEITKATLLSFYLQETSKWLETSDSQRHFSTLSSCFFSSSQLYSIAVLAVASKQLEQIDKMPRGSRELEALLKETLLNTSTCNGTLVFPFALDLFCALFAINGDIENSRQYLRHAAVSIQNNNWNGSTGGLSSAYFWVFARLDIWAAYQTKNVTWSDPSTWYSPASEQTTTIPEQDLVCNKITYILAKIVNELSGTLKEEKARRLMEELQTWAIERPVHLRPVLELDTKNETPWAKILYSCISAATAALFYHAGSILLIQTGLLPIPDTFATIYSAECHAGRIISISTSTRDHAIWINAIEPICIASHLFQKGADKIEVLKHLKEIEKTTGWKTEHKAREMREMWGF